MEIIYPIFRADIDILLHSGVAAFMDHPLESFFSHKRDHCLILIIAGLRFRNELICKVTTWCKDLLDVKKLGEIGQNTSKCGDRCHFQTFPELQFADVNLNNIFKTILAP